MRTLIHLTVSPSLQPAGLNLFATDLFQFFSLTELLEHNEGEGVFPHVISAILDDLTEAERMEVTEGLNVFAIYYTGSQRLPVSVHDLTDAALKKLWGRLKLGIFRVLPLLLEEKAAPWVSLFIRNAGCSAAGGGANFI